MSDNESDITCTGTVAAVVRRDRTAILRGDFGEVHLAGLTDDLLDKLADKIGAPCDFTFHYRPGDPESEAPK